MTLRLLVACPAAWAAWAWTCNPAWRFTASVEGHLFGGGLFLFWPALCNGLRVASRRKKAPHDAALADGCAPLSCTSPQAGSQTGPAYTVEPLSSSVRSGQPLSCPDPQAGPSAGSHGSAPQPPRASLTKRSCRSVSSRTCLATYQAM